MNAREAPPFSEGSVWSIQFARTKPRTTPAFLKQLGENWNPVMEEARRQEVILS